MDSQRHIIKRQVLELSAAEHHLTPRLQDEASRIVRNRLLPLLERCFDRAVDADTVVRIDRLEIDLGRVSLARLDQALTETFEARIGPSLSEATSQAGTSSGLAAKTSSQLELVGEYLRHGTLPWWAEISRPGLVAAGVRHLVEHAPEALSRLLIEAVRNEPAVLRLVFASSDAEVEIVLATLAGRNEFITVFCRELLAWLVAEEGLDPLAVARARAAVWVEGLRVAAEAEGRPVGDPVAAGIRMLERVSVRTKRTSSALASRLRAGSGPKGDGSDGGWLRRLRERLDADGARDRDWVAFIEALPVGHRWSATVLRQLEPYLRGERLGRHWAGMDPRRGVPTESPAVVARGLLALVRELIERGVLPVAAIRRWVVAVLGSIDSAPPEIAAGAREAVDLVRTLIARRIVSATAIRRLLGKEPGRPIEGSQQAEDGEVIQRLFHRRILARPGLLRRLRRVWEGEDASIVSRAGTGGTKRREDERDRRASDGGTRDEDEVHVANAGLVLLWPFLGGFFEGLDLLVDRRFRDETARQRAVGLLDHVATGEEIPSEERLTLNKVLCGMAPDEVFEAMIPATEAERTAAVEFVTSVIARAPILRNMSVAGFRGTFVLRPGQLSVCDDRFLLRVQRETYDVVIERFPWPVRWVRLPWMSAALQVEWLSGGGEREGSKGIA